MRMSGNSATSSESEGLHCGVHRGRVPWLSMALLASTCAIYFLLLSPFATELIKRDNSRGVAPIASRDSASPDGARSLLSAFALDPKTVQLRSPAADSSLSFDAWLAQAGPTPAHLARNVRPVVAPPTASSPFAFFHLRKAGGSTLRFSIYDAAVKHGLTNDDLWVPCKYPKDCKSFDRIPRESFKALYASHINYEELVQARREVAQIQRARDPQYEQHSTLADGKGTTTYYHLDDALHHFDCLTNLRPTVSRVVSCYNFRFKNGDRGDAENWHMPYADELSPDDWTSLLPEAYDAHSGGCNNEVERTFGSINDETIINTITRDSPYFDPELRHAASRMAQCVIVILERCEESNAVLRHYLPWLGEELDLCTTHANAGKTSDGHKQIQEGSEDAILKQNDMDEALFQFGRELFEEQVRIAQSALKVA